MVILCTGLMRSGSTLQYQFATSLVEQADRGQGYGFLPSVPDLDDILTRATTTDRETFYVFKIHRFLPRFESLMRTNQVKVFHSFRDMRDAFISYMNFNDETYRQAIRGNFINKLLTDSARWEAQDDVYIARYEELIHEPASEVTAMAAYLGLSVTPQQAQAIAARFSPKRQHARMEHLQATDQSRDEDDILHHNHIKSGRTNQWKTTLSELEIAHLEHQISEWQRAHGYSLRFGWAPLRYALSRLYRLRARRT